MKYDGQGLTLAIQHTISSQHTPPPPPPPTPPPSEKSVKFSGGERGVMAATNPRLGVTTGRTGDEEVVLKRPKSSGAKATHQGALANHRVRARKRWPVEVIKSPRKPKRGSLVSKREQSSWSIIGDDNVVAMACTLKRNVGRRQDSYTKEISEEGRRCGGLARPAGVLVEVNAWTGYTGRNAFHRTSTRHLVKFSGRGTLAP